MKTGVKVHSGCATILKFALAQVILSGVALVLQDSPYADNGGRLSRGPEESLAMYKAGNAYGGAHRLQDFQDLIFKAAA